MSFWSFITGTTPQSEQQASLDASKQRYNEALQSRIESGDISPEEAQADQQYLDSLALDSTDSAAWEGFQQGAREGLNNVLDAPGKAIGGIGTGASQALWGVLKNIPWWVYVAAVGIAFFYLGGGVLLRRWILRHAR